MPGRLQDEDASLKRLLKIQSFQPHLKDPELFDGPSRIAKQRSTDPEAPSVRSARKVAVSVGPSQAASESTLPTCLTVGGSRRKDGEGLRQDDMTKDAVPKITAPRNDVASVTFALPGNFPEREGVLKHQPDLALVRKEDSAVAEKQSDNREVRPESDDSRNRVARNEEKTRKHDDPKGVPEMSEALADTNNDHPPPVQSQLPQRCPKSTGCYLLQPHENDCYCQRQVKLYQLHSRIVNLLDGIPMDENSVALPTDNKAEQSLESAAAKCDGSTGVVSTSRNRHNHEISEQLYSPAYSSASASSSHAASFNPPTPHPKLYGEFSENDLRVRIAQVHDELRILNLALVRRDLKDSNSDESDTESPESAEFHVRSDAFYLPSAPAVKEGRNVNKLVTSVFDDKGEV